MSGKWRFAAAVLALCLLCGGCASQPAAPGESQAAAPSATIHISIPKSTAATPLSTTVPPQSADGLLAPLGAQAVRLIVLNVGKADALIVSVGDTHYLIDAGYEHRYSALRAALEQLHITRLEAVFLTHCDEDHYGGLDALARSGIAVGAWYASALYHDIPKKGHPLALAAALRGQTPVFLSAGDEVPVPGGAFRVLGPLSLNTDNENNNSLVLLLDTPQGDMLLCGDMKQDEETELLLAGAFTPCEVLKVAHHGDSEASGVSMLARVKPKAAFISTSTADEPDTPDPRTVLRMTSAGTDVLVTQDSESGLFAVLEDGRLTYGMFRFDLPEMSPVSMQANAAQDQIMLSCAQAADLSGMTLYSTRGGELLTLPAGTLLAAGETLTVGSRMTQAESQIIWDEKRVLHKSKQDICILYDKWGRERARTSNGLPE